MLYYLDSEKKDELRSVAEVSLDDVGWTEKDLEDLLAEHIDKLVRADQLFVIAQERQMQEEADIMALDERGTLYLFELKRWKANEDNILQVLRYGQRFGQYEYDRLDNFFQSYRRRHSASGNDVPLRDAHAEHFGLKPALEENAFNREQRFVIVTNGLDEQTWNAIEYWKNYKLPVETLIYRTYRVGEDGEVMIDFDPYGPVPSAPNVEKEGLFVVNTNKTYDPNAFRDMLDNDKACAYEDRKHAVAAIPKGADVCLYHVGVGVVAIGKAKSSYLKASYGEDPDGEFYVPCDFEYKVYPDKDPNKAVSALEINQHFGTGYRFRQTVFTLPAEYRDFIRQRFKERGNS